LTPTLRATGLALALVSATAYGLNISYARLASFAGIQGTTIIFWRVFLMLALAAGVLALTRASLRVAAGERMALVLLGVTTAVVGTAYLSSVAFVPVTVAVVIFYTFPVLVVLLSPFVDGRALTPLRFLIALVAFAGVALVVGPVSEGLDWRGLVLAGIASLGAAAQFFAAARLVETPTAPKILWVHVAVLPVVAAICLATGTLQSPVVLAAAPFAVAVTILAYVLAFALQLAALARLPAAVAGLVFCAEPVVAALSAMLVLGETMSLVQAFGGLLVVGAIVANVTSERAPAPAAAPEKAVA
jgi:drug/metabolite transporter (DMT)-like permease